MRDQLLRHAFSSIGKDSMVAAHCPHSLTPLTASEEALKHSTAIKSGVGILEPFEWSHVGIGHGNKPLTYVPADSSQQHAVGDGQSIPRVT